MYSVTLLSMTYDITVDEGKSLLIIEEEKCSVSLLCYHDITHYVGGKLLIKRENIGIFHAASLIDFRRPHQFYCFNQYRGTLCVVELC